MPAETHQYVDRFFQAAFELTSIHQVERRDGQSLFTFLEALHSLADKLKKNFKIDLQDVPEFILLRIVRNYLHHVGDLSEFLTYVRLHDEFLPSTHQQIIIPASELAAAIKSFRNHEKNRAERAESNLKRLLDFADCGPIIDNTDCFIPKAQLRLDGRVYDLGFDLFKAIYNITNVVADHCRTQQDLKAKDVIANLDATVTAQNNLPKFCLTVRPGTNVLLTTEGHIVATRIERAS